jgi:hypothetical protein
VQCGVIIAVRYGDGVALSQPFLGVSSLNFGPLATVAFFLAWSLEGVEHHSAAMGRVISSPSRSEITWVKAWVRSLESTAKAGFFCMARSSM